MLLELPTADEIDELALSSPSLVVRRFELDLRDRDLDLGYSPCKGEVKVVVRGAEGVVLLLEEGAEHWTLPTDRIAVDEDFEAAAERVARERCGMRLTSSQIMALYDVTRRFGNISVKRLTVVYRAETEDLPGPSKCGGRCEFHMDDLGDLVDEGIDASAISDSLEK